VLQARPLDTCALQRRFDQTESLFVLALWKIYDEFRQSGRAGVVILSLDDFFAKLKSYLPNLLQTPPKSGTYNRVLAALQRRNLVRYSWNETSPGQSELQVLPTILYVKCNGWTPSIPRWSSKKTDTRTAIRPNAFANRRPGTRPHRRMRVTRNSNLRSA
jgi:hypothetical protein